MEVIEIYIGLMAFYIVWFGSIWITVTQTNAYPGVDGLGNTLAATLTTQVVQILAFFVIVLLLALPYALAKALM